MFHSIKHLHPVKCDPANLPGMVAPPEDGSDNSYQEAGLSNAVVITHLLIIGEIQERDKDISVPRDSHFLHIKAQNHLQAPRDFSEDQREVLLATLDGTVQHFCFRGQFHFSIILEQKILQFICLLMQNHMDQGFRTYLALWILQKLIFFPVGILIRLFFFPPLEAMGVGERRCPEIRRPLALQGSGPSTGEP